MKHQELVRQYAAIQSLIKRAGHDRTTHDLEMLGHWAKYLCILSSGFAENMVHLIYAEYIKKTSSTQTGRYATKKIEEVQNPKAVKLVEIARSFDATWGSDLETYLDGNFRKDSINAIMTNRHLIAHGKNSNITIAEVKRYLERLVEIADFLERQCGVAP